DQRPALRDPFRFDFPSFKLANHSLIDARVHESPLLSFEPRKEGLYGNGQ
ncbi:hypothetical protein SERLADRAFT_376976, partial [Serpula lacrymans var. lacrymans S7.9]